MDSLPYLWRVLDDPLLSAAEAEAEAAWYVTPPSPSSARTTGPLAPGTPGTPGTSSGPAVVCPRTGRGRPTGTAPVAPPAVAGLVP